MRSWAGAVLFLLLGLGGCSRQRQPKQAGTDLPVVPAGSTALPGATDAADAPQAPSVAETQGARLTIYRDPSTGVSFLYPAIWRPPVAQTLPTPKFADVAGAPRITQEFSPAGGYYAPTVLLGLSFSYTVKANSNEASCAALPAQATANAAATKKVTYGNVSYTEAFGGDAAACTHVQTQVDSTLRESQCLVFERDFVTSCPYVRTNTLPRPLTANEQDALQRQLDAVMQSVAIARR